MAGDREDAGARNPLHRLLFGALKRLGFEPHEIDDFELIVRRHGDDAILTTYVALSP